MRRTIVVCVVLLVLSTGYGCGSAVVNPEDDIVPTTTPIIEMMPNVALDDDIKMNFEADGLYIVGTATNKTGKSWNCVIEVSFSLYDAYEQQIGTAVDVRIEKNALSPGESWSYRCAYEGKDFKRVVKAVVSGFSVY